MLTAPDSYLAATDAEKAEVCNGAGSAGMGWLVPDTIWGLCITDAANIHDWMYHFGEDEADKAEADSTFLDNMYELIKAGSWWLRSLRRQRARVYYYAVVKFGDDAYWIGKEES